MIGFLEEVGFFICDGGGSIDFLSRVRVIVGLRFFVYLVGVCCKLFIG